jgi:hypothetical protein
MSWFSLPKGALVGGEVRNTAEVIAGRWSKLEVHRALWIQT